MFVAVVLNLKHKAFIVYVFALSINLGDEVHLSKRAQIVYLKAEKAPIKVFSKYADFVDVFSPKLVVELSEHMRINNYAIEVVDD